ncbi:MAG TPA: hypothetical protein VN282_02605 [Pyrinomonadaceae bacterium]|nr:hypothetical protein [Pyrinomonadaceae bacterium]
MRKDASNAAALLLAAAALFTPAVGARAGQGAHPVVGRSGVPESPLAALRDKRRVYLVAASLPPGVVDARRAQDEAGYARAVIAEALKQDAVRRVPDAYRDMADQLRKYSRRYRSLELVERPEDADFMLIFYEMSRSRVGERFGGMYAGGNYSAGLAVMVTTGSAEEPEPRVVSHTEEPLLAGFFIRAFIKELKFVRGEK